MSESFDSLLEEMADAGIDSEFIERIRRSSDNSGARKERDQFKAQAEAALAEAKRYQQVVAGQRFKEFGIKVRPEHLKTPDDLDWADESKVKEWATSAGLIDQAPPEPPSGEVEGHARITNATQSAPPAGAVDAKAALLAKTDPALGVSEDQFWAELRAAGMTNDTTISQ